MENESPEPITPAGADSEVAFEANLDTYAGDAPARRDGWTPFARRLFLEVLAETGKVSRACGYARLSVSSAYALRHRDPAFAAGWDAACELARTALADALYERALDGTTETLTRNGEVIAERHRHDSRLSIAVLHRLDKRCDRAAELGARHLRIIEKWDEWLSLVGKGAETEAAALLEPVRSQTSADLQLPQLPEGANPTPDNSLDLSERCWKDGIEDMWLTDFPPPQGFDGYESCRFDERDEAQDYERACTEEEIAILEADAAADRAKERVEEERLRDAWFEFLKGELPGAEAPAPSVAEAASKAAGAAARKAKRTRAGPAPVR